MMQIIVSSTMSRILCQKVHQFGQKLVRKRLLKTIEESERPVSHLNILNLVILGVSRMLKAGVYILIGAVAKYIAGPGIIISFLVVALFSMLSAFCYAEFGARVPCSGSVYLYSYVTMGQLYAFIIGWNLILRLITGLQVLGAHESILVTKVSVGINLLVFIFIIITGFIKGDLHNWKLTEQDYTLATSGSRSGSRDVYGLGGLHTAVFRISPLIYTMAEDRLLFQGLTRIFACTSTPIMAIMSAGNLTAIMALLFDLTDLVFLVSIGTLLAYSLVAFSVLVLRYQPDQNLSKNEKTEEKMDMHDLDGITLESVPEAGILNILKNLWFPPSTSPTQKSGQIVYGCASLLGSVIYFGYGIRHSMEENNDQQPPASISQTLDEDIPGVESA